MGLSPCEDTMTDTAIVAIDPDPDLALIDPLEADEDGLDADSP